MFPLLLCLASTSFHPSGESSPRRLRPMSWIGGQRVSRSAQARVSPDLWGRQTTGSYIEVRIPVSQQERGYPETSLSAFAGSISSSRC